MLKICVRRVHFAKIHFQKYILEKYTLEKYNMEIWKLLVIAFRKYITSRGLRTLCNGPETPTPWKSESVTYIPPDQLIHWCRCYRCFTHLKIEFPHSVDEELLVGAFCRGWAQQQSSSSSSSQKKLTRAHMAISWELYSQPPPHSKVRLLLLKLPFLLH